MLTKVQRQKECIRTDDGRIQSSAFCRRRDILSAFARTILERLSLMSTVTADGKKKKKRLNFSYDRLK